MKSMCDVRLCAAVFILSFFSVSLYGAGVFSETGALGNGNLDAAVGLNANKTYTHAFNMRSGDVTVNGVGFTGTAGGNYSGVSGSFLLSGFSNNTGGGSTIGAGSALNTLLGGFIYNGNPSALTLTNLVVGQDYVLTFYNKAWGPDGTRYQSLASSGGVSGVYDENAGGEPNANLLRYTFTATGITERVRFSPMQMGTMHLYGFSNEQIFNNTWSGGAAWSTASWGAPGLPDAAGENAVLPAQGAATTIELDVPVTLGHLRLEGVNPWTLNGTNTLVFESDVGGVSVASTPSGAHTISNDITLVNDLLKTGGGKLTLAGTLTGSRRITVADGSLEILTSNTLDSASSLDIADDGMLELNNTLTQSVTFLVFSGVLQSPGTWGAAGSGAQFTSSRFSGSGILLVLGGKEAGTFTASANLGGGDLDASVGLNSTLDYYSALNANGAALTINGVDFEGSSGGNPMGITYSTVNFGNVLNSAQTTLTGQMGVLVNTFNYGGTTGQQNLILKGLIAGRVYTLTLYNRVWGAYQNRTQTITTTSGASTVFNPDNGPVNTLSLLEYRFTASGPTETLTFTRQSSGSYHLYGFSVMIDPFTGYADVTRRDSGSKVIGDDILSDARIIEGTGTPGAVTVESETTTVNSLTQSATNDLTTVDLTGRTLVLSTIATSSDAGALAITNGKLRSAYSDLLFRTESTNPVVVSSAIANGRTMSSLHKGGSGTLVLQGNNSYAGATAVEEGTLRITGGRIGSGLLTVYNSTLQVDGGEVYSADYDSFVNAVVNQTAGLFYHGNNFKVKNSVFNLSGGGSYCAGTALLGADGSTSATVNISGSHVHDNQITTFVGGSVTVNLLSNGILLTDEISNSGAAGTIRFDGGTLAVSTRYPGRAADDFIRSGTSVLIADGGATIDTAAGSVTINRPLQSDGVSAGGLTKSGANTLTLSQFATYGGDTLVAAGTLKLVPIPLELVNAGFESPDLGWSYRDNDGVAGGWSWSDPDGGADRGGIASEGSPWVAADAAPEGTQAGFLQRTSQMYQSVTISMAGEYRVDFMAANRPGYPAVGLNLVFGSATNGSWSVEEISDNAGVFESYSASLGNLQPGIYVLRFVGISPGTTDRATAIDDVRLVRVDGFEPGLLPSTTHLTVADGAVLDLNGSSQGLDSLSGEGQVINNSATTAVFSVGSDNLSTNFKGTVEGNITLAKVGSGTFVLDGSNTYSGVTHVSQGILRLVQSGVDVIVANHSFETYGTLANGSWGYNPTGATWTFAASGSEPRSGMAKPGSPWVISGAAIHGLVAGYLQSRTGTGGSISAPITAPVSGWYRVDFLAGRRWGNYSGTDISIKVDGVTQCSFAGGVFTETGAAFSDRIFMHAGTHTLAFVSADSAGDRATWIDQIQITSIGSALSPLSTAVVETGALLDLGGNEQALAGVSGSGVVSNGNLSVSGIIAPGGLNNIGELTLAATTDLDGATLRADASSNGDCDLLRVQGNLDLSGVALQVEDLNLLDNKREYTVVRCTGTLSGSFSSTNLNAPWSVRYDRVTGRAIIWFPTGTLILIK